MTPWLLLGGLVGGVLRPLHLIAAALLALLVLLFMEKLA